MQDKEVTMALRNQTILLNNTNELPLLGLGLYGITTQSEVETSISVALDAGYRLFDTASSYKNEEFVGKALKQSNIPRDELFITTKVWNTAQRMGDVEGAFYRSLDRMKLDYLDLYLIQWPLTGCYLDTWKEFEKIYASKRVKAIGVCNFTIQDLENLEQISPIVPAVNQIEYHPLYVPHELVSYCQSKGIAVQGYSPLARGAYLDKEIMNVLAEKYEKTPAQIGLRWAIQKGISVIPRSVDPRRIITNSRIFDFALTPHEIETIDSLDEKYKIITSPEDVS